MYQKVVHGTYFKFWPQIKKQGLSKVSRKHIHFAKGTLEDKSIISGMRKDVELYIFIDLAQALNDGIEFFESENGVILCPGNEQGILETKYFTKVLDVKTGKFCS